MGKATPLVVQKLMSFWVLPQPRLTSQWPSAQTMPRTDESLDHKDIGLVSPVEDEGRQYNQYCYYSSLGAGPILLV